MMAFIARLWRAIGRDTSVLWPALLFFALFSLWLLLPIQPNDYWWYLRLAEETLTQGRLPTVDTWSYTQFSQPMVYHSWLSALIFWSLDQLGGLDLTVLARAVALSLFYGLIWFSCRQAGVGPRLATGLVFITALAGSNNWAMRPQLFSYPIFGGMLWLLWQGDLLQRHRRWLLPLGMLLWVNLHGAFVLGFFLVGAAWAPAWKEWRRWGPVLGAMAVASLLNPRGIGAWTYLLTLLRDPASQQLGAEWQSPGTDTWQGALLFVILLLLPLLTPLSPRRLSRQHWLWFVGFGWMALSGVRYGIWFLAVLAPLMAYLLAPAEPDPIARTGTRGIPAVNRGLVLFLIAAPLALLPGWRAGWWTAAPPVLSPDTPVAATAWLSDQPDLPPNLWSDIAFSSYLIAVLPERPVWNDTRFELYPLAQWERYIEIAEAAPNWQDHLDADTVNLMMIHSQRQDRLLLALQQSPAWCQVYADEIASIFARQPDADCGSR